MEIIKVTNLKKKYPRVEALKGVNFSLEEGEILTIIGPSGNGKTTLLRCLNFLEIPLSGKIELYGKTIFDDKFKLSKKQLLELREEFGLVFQNFNLFPQYTVFDNVKMPLTIIEKRRKKEGKESLVKGDMNEEILALLKKLGLSGREKSYPYELSGGEKQRVAIARALILKPKILCFDEPTSALDPNLTKEVIKVIKELKSLFKITMIIVTHEMKFAKAVSEKVMVINNGLVEEIGTTKQIFEQSNNEFVKNFISNN